MEKRALIIELNKQNEGTIEALISFIEVLASRGDNNIEMSYYYGGCVYQRQGLGVMRERGKLFRGKFLDDKLEESSNSSLSTPSQSPFLLPSFFFPPLFSNQNSPASEKLEKLKASKTEKQSKLSNNLLSKKSSTLQLKRKSDNEEQVIGNKVKKQLLLVELFSHTVHFWCQKFWQFCRQNLLLFCSHPIEGTWFLPNVFGTGQCTSLSPNPKP